MCKKDYNRKGFKHENTVFTYRNTKNSNIVDSEISERKLGCSAKAWIFFPESLHMYPGVNARRNAHFLVGKVQNEKGERDKRKKPFI